ncbi:uncharacterized protein LOC131251493 [Magnolia sinica]|uniref:uncharacterized protein LOC131251493 n=1 Tax=Magnolia sinica TaxID=86752 RepID=UPI0026591D70|nr:uncharacterized protein LOC131251493 [Magnolia sinica]
MFGGQYSGSGEQNESAMKDDEANGKPMKTFVPFTPALLHNPKGLPIRPLPLKRRELKVSSGAVLAKLGVDQKTRKFDEDQILGFFFGGVVLNQFGLTTNITDVKILSEWGILFLYLKENPDYKNPVFSTKLGIYSENCGLDEVTMSWGHDEYMHLVAKGHQMTLPPAALFIIRFHSFYVMHRYGAYTYLMDDEDKEMLKWLHVFKWKL